jgi:hypothetical protein
MPKSRGSGTISSTGSTGSENGGATGAAADISELANRLIDRIQQARSVIVQVPSRTRGTTESTQVDFEESGRARVHSASGHTYDVNHEDGTCTCIHHRVRGDRCRHIDAARQAIGELNSQIAPQTENIQTSITDQRNFDEAEEIRRESINADIYDDEYFYNDNEEEFNRTLERSAQAPLTYEYENALNGSRNSFGIELEFVGGNADAIARELHQLGICGYDHRVRYHAPSIPGKWKLENDGSVSSGAGGGELVSPVLYDTPETWRTIQTICEVARRHGAAIDNRCGGHVHIGMDPLDTTRQRWKRFFKSISSFEDVLYRLAGGSLGRIRSGYRRYASQFSLNATRGASSNFMMETDNDVSRLATNISQHNRFFGINLTNIADPNKPNTIELRYFNGSLDPAQIQANVKISNGIITAAQKARTRSNPSETMKRRGEMLRDEQYENSNRQDHSMIKNFVDIFFTRKQDKDHIIGVYAKNTWRN